MKISPLTLLVRQKEFWDIVQANRLKRSDLLTLLGFIVLSCGIYGAVLAGWRSPRLSLYVAVKLPILFLSTIAIVSLFNWMLASILGAGLSFRLTVVIVFASMTIAAWILLSLAPIALFFVLSGIPYSGTSAELRYAHNCILMTHISILAIAGITGNVALYEGLCRLVAPRCRKGILFLAWFAMFALVGCQMAWILRPFVGSPFFAVAFMRPDCFDRNFYEFVFGEVLPNLIRGGQ